MGERRREERHSLNTVVKVDKQLAMIKDLSSGGMRVTAQNLKPDQVVDLNFQHGHESITMKGLVKWVKQSFPFESYCECGMVIVGAPSEYQNFLVDLSHPQDIRVPLSLWPFVILALTMSLILIIWV